MVSFALCSKAVIALLIVAPIRFRVFVGPLFCGVVLGVLSRLAIILLQKMESWLFVLNLVVAVSVFVSY